MVVPRIPYGVQVFKNARQSNIYISACPRALLSVEQQRRGMLILLSSTQTQIQIWLFKMAGKADIQIALLTPHPTSCSFSAQLHLLRGPLAAYSGVRRPIRLNATSFFLKSLGKYVASAQVVSLSAFI